jgi:hypothetical protein
MIGVIFSRAGNEVVEIRIEGNNICWRSTEYGSSFFPIDTLDFDRNKVFSEFPDLEDNPAWREVALKRLKDKINSIDTEKKKANYIIEELGRIGYQPHSYQIQGSRTKKWLGRIV